MSPLETILERPANLTTPSKYTAIGGIIYLAGGAILIVWPGAAQTIFMGRAFVGDESGLMRVIGMSVAIIGWFYLIGGRSGVRQFVAASVFDRLILVPIVLIPLAIAGVFPYLFLAFTLLDIALAIDGWVLFGREPLLSLDRPVPQKIIKRRRFVAASTIALEVPLWHTALGDRRSNTSWLKLNTMNRQTFDP
jgi:hypothetical protein